MHKKIKKGSLKVAANTASRQLILPLVQLQIRNSRLKYGGGVYGLVTLENISIHHYGINKGNHKADFILFCKILSKKMKSLLVFWTVKPKFKNNFHEQEELLKALLFTSFVCIVIFC